MKSMEAFAKCSQTYQYISNCNHKNMNKEKGERIADVFE